MKKIILILSLAVTGCATHYDGTNITVYDIEKHISTLDTSQERIYAQDVTYGNKMTFLAYPEEGFKIGSKVNLSTDKPKQIAKQNTVITNNIKKIDHYCLVKKYSPAGGCFIWAIYDNGIPVAGYYTPVESDAKTMYYNFIHHVYSKADTILCDK